MTRHRPPDELALRKADWGDGPVDEESYFVFSGGRVVARIILHNANIPERRSWQWMISQVEAGDRWDGDNYQGYEPTREAAMEALARAWRAPH